MSSQLAFGASKSPSPPSPSPCQSPSPCESASASVPHLHLHHHLHLHVHHHLRLRLHLHRHPHRLISVLLLRLIHNTKRYDRCRVGGCPEGLAIRRPQRGSRRVEPRLNILADIADICNSLMKSEFRPPAALAGPLGSGHFPFNFLPPSDVHFYLRGRIFDALSA